MSWTLDDIIVAVASPPGAGMRGIVRASGPDVQSRLRDSFECEAGAAWMGVRRATRFEGELSVAGLSTQLRCALWFWPNHRSYTGQPTIEIHTIGSPPILDAIVQDLVARGARLARPGEFTLRSFLAGKIDLVQAEAVLGVIDADSTDRLQQALTQLSGGVSARIRDLRESLLIDLADLEAGLDFVDEDIEFVERSAMIERLEAGIRWIGQLRQHTTQRSRTTGRKLVVLAGLPNAGKSTLFNALVGENAAVVSPIAGTTRDWLSAVWNVDGFEVDLIDTAGVEEALDEISAAAQQGARDRGHAADLLIWCTPGNLSAADRLEDAAAMQRVIDREVPMLHVVTKGDDVSANPDHAARSHAQLLAISAITGAGIRELSAAVRERLELEDRERGELLSSTLARCQGSLAAAEEALNHAQALAEAGGGDELISLELRRGLDALGEIAGVIYTDDLLDRIFSRFCIGK